MWVMLVGCNKHCKIRLPVSLTVQSIHRNPADSILVPDSNSSPPSLPSTPAAASINDPQQPDFDLPHDLPYDDSSDDDYTPSSRKKARKMTAAKSKTKSKTATKSTAPLSEVPVIGAPSVSSPSTPRTRPRLVMRKPFANPKMSADDLINPPFVGHHFLDVRTREEYNERKEKLMVECQRLAALTFKTKFQRYHSKKPRDYESDGEAEDLDLTKSDNDNLDK